MPDGIQNEVGIWRRVYSIYNRSHFWRYDNIKHEIVGYLIIYVVTDVSNNTVHAREELARERIWQEIQT